MRIGVVADDITGANDIGAMFALAGYLVHVYTYSAKGDLTNAYRREDAPEVVIINTNSRLDPADVAATKVSAATLELQAEGCKQFFNKTCSVFRGNIGAEFDAMLDALGDQFAIVVLGFPKNGRTAIDGVHYVRGMRLEESEFRHDPMHPMRRSDLAGILGSQSSRCVSPITHDVIEKGAEALRRAIEERRTEGGYVILDVVDQESLKTIAAVVSTERVLCGSSALAEELPAQWGPRETPLPPLSLAPWAGKGIVVAAGSLMPQTRMQTALLQEQGCRGIELDTIRLFEQTDRRLEIDRAASEASRLLILGEDVLIAAPSEPDQVEATRSQGVAHGQDPTETARLVSTGIAEAVGQTVQRAGVRRIAVAGGETSAAVCDRLGVSALRIWQEIQPGLPSCVSLTEPRLLLVLKSGSFGSPDFLVQAVQHLKEQ